MAKSFKKFREDAYEDEWGDNEDRDFRKKDRRLKTRRDERKKKAHDKFAALDERFEEDD